ncbi:ATP-dependent DNA helicase [Paracidovorax valerianellae]|uniref:ATP-dependent DNA helicase n=1 Tax=Paracidovorax valerianellae TaxID=187868 RepID=UPI002302884E|nr:ATP-dependent DNA helicase [Paracidovorax valerianellae]MDA8443523.1 ATP-dependent DNA helicase [Paracidovorax valerianellae]
MYTVAVRELCEFTAKQGDLDLRFTPAPTALEGIAGHATVAQRRMAGRGAGAGPGYESEVALEGQHRHLRVRGRADGFDPAACRLDEVKTFKGRLDRQPASHRALHWAQAKVYGWLLCQARQLARIDVALVYFDIGSQQETVLVEPCTADALRAHFEAQCERFLGWAEQEAAHRTVRDAALRAAVFPFGGFRTGQRPLAEAVYRSATAGRCLLAQAPTGIGKTVGTLFPLLKAAPGERLDKVFFLTAKTSGRQVALDALARIAMAQPVPASASPDAPVSIASSAANAPGPAGLPLRVLELIAREKACEHPGQACHGESCPLARGFYDRLPAARAAALAPAPSDSAGGQLLDQSHVRDAALAHGICPYYLGQELARWADVVVGDYHYYFDAGALLHGLTQANQWRVAVLVDEAHNLVERGRRMYTAELLPDSLYQARHSDTAARVPAVKKALDKVRRAWVALDKAQPAPYAVHDAFPAALLAALQQCGSTLADHFAEHPEQMDPALQAFYLELLHTQRLADCLDTHSMVDVARSPGGAPGSSVVCLRNVVPAPFLAPRFAAAHTSTLFSATLQPARYYADLLGLPASHAGVDVASPFHAAQLRVSVARHISTRYPHRAASLQPIAELMARQFGERPGNYLAFFSSYEYLQQVAEAFALRHPEVPHWCQSRRMQEAEQREFLARFTEGGQGIGFAVLGGAFSEGIDLPGRRLIGAFLSTLGLPQMNPVNEQIRQRMHALFGEGYDYTYLYPGLQKVVQAAGRVIRSPSDEGVVHLIDDRFARAEVQRLLPAWWTVEGSA